MDSVSAIAVLTAMITPAVLISACGSMILSTSSRLGRVVDRVRALADRLEAMPERNEIDKSATERQALIFQQLDKLTTNRISFISDDVSNPVSQSLNAVNREPSYLGLLRDGVFQRRVEELEHLLERCTVCPRDCFNNRLKNEIAACYSGRMPIVSSYTPHFGEEPPLVGTRGAGNIFFGNCNLRCVYCQNYQISQTHKEQLRNEVTHERLAEMMLELQSRGCHNINFVSPTHFAPQMARAILLAAQQGLHLPIVYNTNAYDSVEVLRLLNGVVDIYLPDLKYADDESGYLYSKVNGYRDFSRLALKEMYRQTGQELVFDESGLLIRGLVIRLLVLPNDVACVRESIEWIRDELSPRVAISLMAQYYPTNQADKNKRYVLLSRRIRESEWMKATAVLEELGVEEGWVQEFDGASYYYRPDFKDAERPFKDIRDFEA